jgi:hypothetical protein
VFVGTFNGAGMVLFSRIWANSDEMPAGVGTVRSFIVKSANTAVLDNPSNRVGIIVRNDFDFMMTPVIN